MDRSRLPDHGPIDGPKIDVAADMGGTIVSMERPHPTIDSFLFVVKWDNGQASRHYSIGLFSIGRFQTRSKFEAAITLTGSIEVTVGSQGGFRIAKISMTYEGEEQNFEIFDRNLWLECLEPLAKKHGARISTIKLPPKNRTRTK